MTFSSLEYRWTTSLSKKGCLPFTTQVTISCLTHWCFHSHWYFIVPLRDTRLTILTSKDLRYNLLAFTTFIIQLQVGAIPVFSRQCLHPQTTQVRSFNWSLPKGKNHTSIVSHLSVHEMNQLGVNNKADMMTLRMECSPFGNRTPQRDVLGCRAPCYDMWTTHSVKRQQLYLMSK